MSTPSYPFHLTLAFDEKHKSNGHSPNQTPKGLRNSYTGHTSSAYNKSKHFINTVISIKVLNNKPEAVIKTNKRSYLYIYIYVYIYEPSKGSTLPYFGQ